MTHAQMGMDEAVRKRFLEEKPQPSNWQLKRFSTIQSKVNTNRNQQKNSNN
jgi:hypothetical protein